MEPTSTPPPPATGSSSADAETCPTPCASASVPPTADTPKTAGLVLPPVEIALGYEVNYPMQGIGKLVRIDEKVVDGVKRNFYVFAIEGTERDIVTSESTLSQLRRLLTEQEVQEIFDTLRERTTAFDSASWKTRLRECKEKVDEGRLSDVVEVVRDLYRRKTDMALNFTERRLLEAATGLLVKDLALARRQTEEQARADIEAVFFQ